ncbi:SpoVR family protein [Engelhardtia mirabilis]|uniref:SpoVR family protein n=1 Tax=Engelhardtia mirabilis TaxID=2528011 RepID=A0A518BJC2_9BACT|nr:SpoVR family protein [Planctomycetes bacterium Pla133]QDV01398.1 SpoVR family protein [Planctomycetes bacterium Pla86]
MRLRHDLPTALKYHALVIEKAAAESGLDHFDVCFELLDARDVNGVAAYGGFPVRYPSWRFGMDFERLQKGYDWGLSKIYELVINNDPTIAYLVRSNSLLEQKLVMAHVFGHADFFKHNACFAGTDRHMLDTMGRHSTQVRRIIDSVGLEKVERSLDRLLSLDGLIDPYLHRHTQAARPKPRPAMSERSFQLLEQMSEPLTRDKPVAELLPVPDADLPTLDILGYLEKHAPLSQWERELLRIVRAEAYYFAPQRLTKIANEGWACYWHSKILTGGILEPSEVIDFADVHSGATSAAPGQLNPYRLGLRLMRYAESKGHDLFLLRSVHSDVSLIDELVDEQFVLEYLGIRRRDLQAARQAGLDWVKWKEKLLGDLAWGGLPKIELIARDAHTGCLRLRHHHDGRDLQLAQAGETIKNLAAVWGGPVEIETLVESSPRILRAADGQFELVDLDEPPCDTQTPPAGPDLPAARAS